MLENFAKKEIKHLGVDPSANVVEEAKISWRKFSCRFFWI